MISINFTHTSTVTQSIEYFGNRTQDTFKNDTQKTNDVLLNTPFAFQKNPFENSNFTNTSYGMPNDTFTEYAEIPHYIKATSMTFCIVIMCLGVIGNVMVPIVILKTKDMRNSTNIFLVNLSIADLMVLLVCTPTVLVEVNSKPETWVLGKELCLAVPFVELTVAHASVLTILAISFERYYAICEPLRAGYVCTKTRATLICALAWFFAALFTSPILVIAEHHTYIREDGTEYSQCLTQASTFWQITFFVMVIILLYILPLIILIILYSVIAKNLITAASKIVMNKTVDPCNARARKQVILMLGTVVLCFFLCLMPYRLLALWIIITPSESSDNVNPEKWYNILYFSRIMLYINSAINPILYNLMSSKFRIGFCKICVCVKKNQEKVQSSNVQRTVTSGSTTSSSLTRTTNSLKKLFTHRTSLERNDNDSESKESKDVDGDQKRRIFERMFPRKRFNRQQSSPECSNAKLVNINRMRSVGNMVESSDAPERDHECKSVESSKFITHPNVSVKNNRSDIELETHYRYSLRRSILLNSTKSKNTENGTDKNILYKKIDSDRNEYEIATVVDNEFPESFV